MRPASLLSASTRDHVRRALGRIIAGLGLIAVAPIASAATPPLAERAGALIESYCAGCHDDVEKKGGLDLTALKLDPTDAANFRSWVKVHDRLQAGEMPPQGKKRPDATELEAFLQTLATSLTTHERDVLARVVAEQRSLSGEVVIHVGRARVVIAGISPPERATEIAQIAKARIAAARKARTTVARDAATSAETLTQPAA